MKNQLLIFKKKFCTDQPNKIEYGLAILIFFLIYSTMYYTDNFAIFCDHFHKVESLINGRSLDILGATSLPYGLMHQWICEIWVLPINLLYHLFGLDYTGPIAILWYKLLIPLCLVLCMKIMGEIAQTLEVEEKNIRWMQFLFATAILVVLPVLHIAQTDSIYLVLMLKGFHSLLKGDTKHFLLWFGLSVSFKMISIFVFIPLILLEEKRILYVFRNVILGCIIIPLQHIWYRLIGALNQIVFVAEKSNVNIASVASAAEEKATAQGGFYSKIFKYTLFFDFPAVRRGYTASVLIVLFVLFCIWCYLQKNEKNKEWQQKCVYASVVALLIFFMNASPGPFWIVILYPFLFLLLYTNSDRLRFNLILEKAFTLTLFLVYVISGYWVYGGAQTFDKLFLEKWGIIPYGHELQGGPNIAGYLAKVGINELMPIVIGVCLACAIGIAWINYPKVKCDEELDKEYVTELHHGFAIVNILILFIWYVINVILIGRY